MKKISLLFFFLLLLGTSCTKEVVQEVYNFYAMDTIISITFYDVEQSKEIAKNIEQIYKTYAEVADDFSSGEQVVSVYDLNQKREATITTELKELLEFSLQMQTETNGYFNPFIGRLSHLWKQALDQETIPEDNVIQQELEIMQKTELEFDNLHVKILGEGNIDLGGVAKGFATSKAKEYLEAIECRDYLLNAGASNIVLGSKKGNPFVVGLSKTFSTGYYQLLKIKEKSIATSSIKEQYKKIGDKLYSHLLNPLTGYPAMLYDSISIIGEDSKELDVYSTACFAMEFDQIQEFLANKNLEFILSKEDQILFQSEGVKAYA